jgi:pantothenate kinase-related protein Tda10
MDEIAESRAEAFLWCLKLATSYNPKNDRSEPRLLLYSGCQGSGRYTTSTSEPENLEREFRTKTVVYQMGRSFWVFGFSRAHSISFLRLP